MGAIQYAIETFLIEHDVPRITHFSVGPVRLWRLFRTAPKYINIDAAIRSRPEDAKAWLESTPTLCGGHEQGTL
jgi:hypothetical protein